MNVAKATTRSYEYSIPKLWPPATQNLNTTTLTLAHISTQTPQSFLYSIKSHMFPYKSLHTATVP